VPLDLAASANKVAPDSFLFAKQPKLASQGWLCKRGRVPYSVVVTDGAPPRNSERHLHQNDSTTTRRMARRRVHRICWAVLIAFFGARAAHAEVQPTAAMMEPVQGLVTFMSTLRRGEQPTVFARRGLCIVENFAPYLFCGSQAAANWSAGFRAHAAEGDLKNLAATFGAAHDFSQTGKRVYFSLPTTWTGITQGKHFEEHGAWSFVLVQEEVGWRIVGYGWGVTAYSETPR
jgi:hypothetical protein